MNLSEAESAIATQIALAREPLLVRGAGTKFGMLRPVQAADVISTAGLTGITLYAPKELIISARAGTPLHDIETVLAANGQHLIAEPPDLATLLLTPPNTQTLGGVIATNLSGPRRVAWGAMRDHVMGVRAVTGRGEVIHSGGRVLKNVTGLDLCKLLAGSHGTLGVMTEITLKVLPAPEMVGTIVIPGLEAEKGVAALSAALGSPYGVSGAAWLPAGAASWLPEQIAPGRSLTLIRIEDFAASVVYRSARLLAELDLFGAFILDDPASRKLWGRVRDVRLLPVTDSEGIWRVSVRPSSGPAVLRSVPGATGYLDWGGGLVWFAAPPNETTHRAVEAAARAAGGTWTLMRAPDSLRNAVNVVPPEPAPLAAITRRVKRAMDPRGILNPGRITLDYSKMQTSFSAEQLRDPDTAVANQVLRSCVHCGLCTATCPTFQLLGDELDSPRGRIYLIKDMLETNRPATPEVVLHVDRCLSCLSCMTTCPSGVHYMHLVDHARAYIERTYRRPVLERLIRGLLGWIIPRPRVFRAALAGARLAGPLVGRIPGQSMFAQRVRAITALAPANVPHPDATGRLRVHKAMEPRKWRVALLAGCAQIVLAPEINAATIRLLTRLGCEVVVPKGAGCCGSLNHHMGQHSSAMALARANIEAWSREIDSSGLDAVVINASGCGTTVKDYGFMFRTEPDAVRAKAERIAALAVDVTELLTRLGYAPQRPGPGLTVAYHSACSLQHGQQITNEPKALLRKAGFRVVEPPEGHLCCGSAGTYNMLQPGIAQKLRIRKLRNIAKTKPDLVATGNIGCITQLSGGVLPVVHTVALLDWMAGGPRPEGIPEAAS